MALGSVCGVCHSSDFARDHQSGDLVCARCGTVVDDSRIVSEVTFAETAQGKAVVTGQYVANDQRGVLGNSLYGMQSGESRHQTIEKARHRMDIIGHRLNIPTHVIEAGLRFFRTALANNFVKGRKSQHVLSACLYLACRLGKTDHMLMDFAELIGVNVFHIGATYLQLVRNQRIKELPIVDPTVYIQRFTARLQFGSDGGKRVVNDAKLLVQRMGKDWLQQGRRPAGVAAACILLAARMNNFRRSKAEIVQVAKIAEETLQRRLDEFKNTSAGTLTVQDFRGTNIESAADPPSFTRHRELERKMAEQLAKDDAVFGSKDGVLPPDPYLDEEMVRMAKELDREDGQQLELLSDVDAVLELPTLQEAVRDLADRPRLSKRSSSEVQDVDSMDDDCVDSEASDDNLDNDDDDAYDDQPFQAAIESLGDAMQLQSSSTEASLRTAVGDLGNENTVGRAEKFLVEFRKRRAEKLAVQQAERERELERSRKASLAPPEPNSESLSDVDDDEIESVLLTEEEIDLKSKVWVSINREYLLEQERKRLRAESDAAQGIVKPTRKRRKVRQPQDPNRPSTAGSSAANMLKEKVHSKKINYAAVTKLFSHSK